MGVYDKARDGCVICGDYVPEGAWVCKRCEWKEFDNAKSFVKIKKKKSRHGQKKIKSRQMSEN